MFGPGRGYHWVPVLLVALLMAGGCRAPEPEPAAPSAAARQVALLVVLDAARPDRFSCYGYGRETTPNLDALAAAGVRFDAHRTTATATRSAVPSLLWSRYFVPPLLPISAHIPLSDTADLNRIPGVEARSLPHQLRMLGFQTAAVSAHPWICDDNVGLSDFDEVINVSPGPDDPSPAYASAGPAVDAAIRWLGEHPDRDIFLYLHLMDPHFPHALGPEARGFLDDQAETPLPDPLDERFLRELERDLTAAERVQLDALVDGSLAHADAHLGRLFQSLGMPLDQALVVVTADHGEHLLEVPGRVGHDGPWYEAVARVPLIVHHPPSLSPDVVTHPTSAVDVAPTVAELLAPHPVRWGVHFDGRDLLAPAAAPPADLAVSPSGIVLGTDKCLFHDPPAVVLDPDVTTGELQGERYDLAVDPRETRDLWAEDSVPRMRCVDAYRQELTDAHQRYRATVRHVPPRLPFALGVDAMALETVTAQVSVGEDRPLSESLRADSWLRIRCGRRTVLGTAGGEAAVPLRLVVPRGRYRISLGALGAAHAALGDGESHLVELHPVDPDRRVPGRFEEAELGVVDIPNGGIELILTAEPGRGFLLRHVLLEPTLEEDESSVPVPVPGGLDEQLRALGYVE